MVKLQTTTTAAPPQQPPAFNVSTALGPNDPDDGAQGRSRRGLAIAITARDYIQRDKHGYSVPSQSGNGAYLVNLDYGPFCTCPDFEKRNEACKHVYAVEAVLRRDALPAEPPLMPSVSRPWAVYDQSQIHEGDLFATLLRSLCDSIPQPSQTTGRPRFPLSDMVYGMGLKVYSTLSGRRAMSEIREAVSDGRMEREPNFTTIGRYFEREDVTPVLRQLIQASALPLRDVEVDFALDSSGFASTAYNRWLDHKYGASHKKARWCKLHIMCGVRSNIVTVADATASMSADAPYLPDFVAATAEHFTIRDVSADAAYSSRQNLHAIVDAGGTPYIPFKSNSTPKARGRGPDPLWEQMYRMFTYRSAEFNRHYHKRSNVETCFQMIKARFRNTLRAKTDTAMVNETLMRVLAHNICVLIRTMYVLGITPVFDTGSFASELALVAKGE